MRLAQCRGNVRDVPDAEDDGVGIEGRVSEAQLLRIFDFPAQSREGASFGALLSGLEHVGIGAELDEEVGLGGAGELGVPGGVVPAAAGAAVAGAAEEEVGVAVPAVGDEVGLVDDGGG